MGPSLVLRCSRPVLNRLFLLLSVFAVPVVLRAQPTTNGPGGIVRVPPGQLAVPTTGGGLSVAVNPATNKIYVPSNDDLHVVNVIDGATHVTKAITLGTNPTAVAVNPVTNKVYVSDIVDNTVTVIDGASDTVTATIPVGTEPYSVAVNTVTNRVYVPNTLSNNVTVIDGATNNIIATVATTATHPDAVAVNPVTNKIYVTNSTSAAGNVTVIDGATNLTAPVSVSGGPQSIAVNPVTNQIWVTSNPNTVTVINGVDNSEITHVTVGTAIRMVTVNSVTNKAYAVNFDDVPNNTAFEIDGTTFTPTAVTLGGTYPYTLAVNPVTNKIFVACYDLTASTSGEGSITVIDGATLSTTVLPVVGDGNSINIVAVNPVTNRVYSSIPGDMSVLDGASNITSTVPVGSGPRKAVVNQVTNKIYVTNYGSGGSGSTVSVIDGATNTVTNTVSVDPGPFDLDVNPVTNKVYVGNYGRGDGTTPNTVSIIDGATNAVTPVTVGVTPTAVRVNPVTNKIYVANFGTSTTGTNGSVSVIDGASGTVTKSLPWVGSPDTVTVNPATNKIYVATFRAPGSPGYGNTVSVIDGATDTIKSTVTVNLGPYEIAVNSMTNKIYVSNYQNGIGTTVSVIDGTADTVIATLTVGLGPLYLEVNEATNKIYVGNYADSTISVIDGATDTVIATVPVGAGPYSLTVNPVTDNLYIPNNGTNTVSVIDGASNTVTTTLTAGTNPYLVAVNPVTNMAYVANANSGNVTVIDVDGHQNVPLSTTAVGVTDPLTVSTTNVFQTGNPAPSFTVNVNSVYSSTSIYTGKTVTNPPPTQVYYEVDGANPSNLATATSSSGANPANFSLTLGQQQIGLHTLYVYAAYGNEGGQYAELNGGGNSPEIGNLTAYPFLIVPLPTTTTVTADVNPQAQGQPVTLTALVTPSSTPSEIPAPTGTVTFQEGGSALGTGSINSANVATFTTSSLGVGDHIITATYSGDAYYGESTSPVLTVKIMTTLAPTIGLVGGNNQTTVYGTTFAQPLVVMVSQSDGTPVAGTTVTFAGANLSFSPSGTVTTNSNGQASVMATGTLAGVLTATASTSGATSPVNFAMTVNKATLTVAANNIVRLYGQTNPTLTTTITGFVNGDTSTVVSGTAAVSTTATTVSTVGPYSITATQGTLSATNYGFAFVNGILTVNKATLTVTAGNATRLFGQPDPTFTTTITGFVNGDTSAVVSGAAAVSTTATTASPAGAYPITAAQGTLSAMNYGFVFVNGVLRVTNIVVTPPPAPVPAGSPVTLTATVPAGATGTVTFYDGTTVIGVVQIPTSRSGVTTVTLQTSSLSPGTHTITAVYSGDANFPSSISPPVSVTITPGAAAPDFVMTSSTGQQLIPPGASATYTIVVSSTNSPFTNPITMSASNLPPDGTYAFNPAVVTPGTAGGSTAFTVSVPKQSSMASHGSALGPAALALLLLPLACLKRYRGSPPRLLTWTLFALISLGALSGCGIGGYFSQTQQTYVITVTGTSGSLVRNTTVTLTVQ